jgi:hypothetical protein
VKEEADNTTGMVAGEVERVMVRELSTGCESTMLPEIATPTSPFPMLK